MKVYLDDHRIPKSPEVWCIVRTAEEAMKILDTGDVTYISLDHDLGEELTGYDVACYIETLVRLGTIRCPLWNVHSANPVGAQRIVAAMKSAEAYQAEADYKAILLP